VKPPSVISRAWEGGAVLPLLVSILWHGLGLALFVNWSDVVRNPPIHYTDYANHYAGVWEASHHLESGHLWGYSPFFHAGYPAGTLFEADNKGVELATWTLHRLGLPLPHAFDVVILTLMAVAPFGIYLAARLIGLSRRAGGLSQLLALALWYGDPTVSWTWQGGTLAYVTAASGSLVVAAAFWRWAGLAGEEGARTLALWPWFGVGPLLFWLHPWAFFVLVVPLGAGTLLAWRGWSWRRRVVPVLWAGWVLLLTWPWLRLILRFLPDKTSSAQFLQGGLAQLTADAGSRHILIRLAVLGSAAVGLWLWSREGRRLWLPVGASIVTWLALAYGGVYLGAGDLQPYRFVIPALALGALPAAVVVAQLWRRSPSLGLLAVILLLLSAMPALYSSRPHRRQQADGTSRAYLSGPSVAEHAVCETLRQLDLTRGRVTTNDWRLGAYLPPCSGAQVIGGPFLWVWTTYGYANAGLDDLLGRPLSGLDSGELEGLLTQYNVRWAVVNTKVYPRGYDLAEWARDSPGLLALVGRHGVFEIYAVTRPAAASWFFDGSGGVKAQHNRLSIEGSSPGGVVLKYHWIESLRAEPPLPLRPSYMGDDPVPFIAVDSGEVSDFVIVQDYG